MSALAVPLIGQPHSRVLPDAGLAPSPTGRLAQPIEQGGGVGWEWLVEAWQVSKSANQQVGKSTNGESRLTFDASHFTFHVSHITFHASLVTPHHVA